MTPVKLFLPAQGLCLENLRKKLVPFISTVLLAIFLSVLAVKRPTITANWKKTTIVHVCLGDDGLPGGNGSRSPRPDPGDPCLVAVFLFFFRPVFPSYPIPRQVPPSPPPLIGRSTAFSKPKLKEELCPVIYDYFSSVCFWPRRRSAWPKPVPSFPIWPIRPLG